MCLTSFYDACTLILHIGQRRKEKYAQLERQAKSGSSGSAESSSSPESTSESGSQGTQAGASDYGVSLPEFGTDGFYVDGSNALTTADIDLGLTAFLDPPSLTNGFDFSNNMNTEMNEQSYELYRPEASLPMDEVLDVPILKTLKAGGMIAQMIGCETLLWDPTSRWTIATPTFPGLPDNMQPTQAQLTIPHHPLFDILPWPQLRTKLICVFAMPEQQRPTNARDEMALVRCAYDIEDATDGFRVNGEGMNTDDWEVGEAFFKNWWWALDRNIVENSNAWRQKRGRCRLSIQSA